MNKFSLVFISLTFAASAMADNGQQNNAQQYKDQAVQQRMSFEDIKSACLNPARFHNQVAPSNIQIACKDVQSKWVADDQGSYSMGCGRMVTATVASDKYTSDAVSAQVKAAPQITACPRFKEITESVDTVRAVTCAEIVAFTGSSTDFCADAINSLRAVNPKAVIIANTGQTVSLCTGVRGQLGYNAQQDNAQQDNGKQDYSKQDNGQQDNGPDNGQQNYGVRAQR